MKKVYCENCIYYMDKLSIMNGTAPDDCLKELSEIDAFANLTKINIKFIAKLNDKIIYVHSIKVNNGE